MPPVGSGELGARVSHTGGEWGRSRQIPPPGGTRSRIRGRIDGSARCTPPPPALGGGPTTSQEPSTWSCRRPRPPRLWLCRRASAGCRRVRPPRAAAVPTSRRWSAAPRPTGPPPAAGTSTAELDPQRPVQLVVGDREQGSTRFEPSTLGDYLRSVAADEPSSHDRHLKEFDLLGAFPRLREDLRMTELFPPGHVISSSAWIGPTGARNGLHLDLLDNAAVQVVGHKKALPAVSTGDRRAGRCALEPLRPLGAAVPARGGRGRARRALAGRLLCRRPRAGRRAAGARRLVAPGRQPQPGGAAQRLRPAPARGGVDVEHGVRSAPRTPARPGRSARLHVPQRR